MRRFKRLLVMCGLTVLLGACQTTSDPNPIPTPGGTSSFDLIDQAQTAGQLDEVTALEYRVFATFGDPRLPAAYRGDQTGVTESQALEDLGNRLDSLPAEAQSLLAPFLLPPAYQGSWAAPLAQAGPPGIRTLAKPLCGGTLAPGWEAINDPAGKVKVWYDSSVAGDRDRADTIDFAINNEIWPALVDRLGMKAPPSDAKTIGCDGGDGRLDVYVANIQAYGAAGRQDNNLGETFGSRCDGATPSYILISHALTGNALKATVAHEFMHALQYAYNNKSGCNPDYTWLHEATATWAEDYVYPAYNTEQVYASPFLNNPEKPLNHPSQSGEATYRDYGSYLFFQFLAHTLGPATIRQTWEASETHTSSLEALDSALMGGGLREQWAKFARLNFNQPPVDGQSYKGWDGLKTVPRLALGDPQGVSVKLGGAGLVKYTLKDPVDSLSLRYYRFTFADPTARTILYDNPYRDFKDKVHVQVFEKIAGSWHEEDWTDQQYIGFCRDRKDQRLEELDIVISNGEWQDRQFGVPNGNLPTLSIANLGCWGFDGTVTQTGKASTWTGDGVTISGQVKYRGGGLYTNASEGRLHVMLTAPALDSGSLTFSGNYQEGSCRYSFPSQTVNIRGLGSGGSSASNIIMNYFLEALPDSLSSAQQGVIGPDNRAYFMDGVSPTDRVSGSATCDGKTSPASSPLGTWLLTGLKGTSGSTPKAHDDGTLQGSFDQSSKGGTLIYTWKLAPQSEP